MLHKHGIPCVGPGCFTCNAIASRARVHKLLRKPSEEMIAWVKARMLVPVLRGLSKSSRLLRAEWVDGPLPPKPVAAPSQKYFFRLCQMAQGAVPFCMDSIRRDVISLFKVLHSFNRLDAANVELMRMWVKEMCMSQDHFLKKIMQFPLALECIRSDQDVGFKLATRMLDMRLQRWDPSVVAREWYLAGVDHHCQALVAGLLRDVRLCSRTRGAEAKASALEVLRGEIEIASTACRRLALAMAFHRRLGKGSVMGDLSTDMAAEIAGMAEPGSMCMWSNFPF